MGPPHWVCPGSNCLRKLQLSPEPRGQGSRAGLSKTGQSSTTVGGWVDATILENLGGTHGLGGALQLRDVAPIRSVPTEPVPLGVPA